MILPVNIESLINKNVVESNRIEYKKGWNPDSIYRSICAFANDFDDEGGGYIIIGVEEHNGRALRPVVGLDIEQLDTIQKEMVGFNNLIVPYYAPKMFIEEVDGKMVIIFWVTAGDGRPYKVPDQITAKHKNSSYYIRYNSNSIVAKGEYELELMNLANRIPFDDRGNIQAKPEDISMLLVRDFLTQTRSRAFKRTHTFNYKENVGVSKDNGDKTKNE